MIPLEEGATVQVQEGDLVSADSLQNGHSAVAHYGIVDVEHDVFVLVVS